ncbi:MAG: terminase gpA endonuclease subunit, partial [Desulfovibrionaceae bacterium]
MQCELCPRPSVASPTQTPQRQCLTIPAIPAWLPETVARDVRAHCARLSPLAQKGGGIVFTFSKGEKKVMRRRKKIPVSQWAERHRVLEMSSIPGKWKNLFTPYLVGIMDAAGTTGIETVIVCKSPQTGGSEAGHNLVGWCIDRSPGPVLYVYPDEITARENAKDRIIPMLTASPRLRDYMTGTADDASSLRINMAHMPIYLGWSGSVSRLGNKPIRTLILDELDKYKNPKNEATSETLAELRTTTWRNRKHILKISTPTTEEGPIWQALTQEAGARFDYWVACPHCGIHQLMHFERIDWPGKPESCGAALRPMGCRGSGPAEGRGGEQPPHPESEPSAEIMLTKRLATYPCEHCGAVWDDGDRDRAVRRGQWRERSSGLELMNHIAVHKTLKVGFHIPAWLSYFVSLSEVAAAALKYKESGKLDDLKTLQNQYKAEPWQQERASRSEDAI